MKNPGQESNLFFYTDSSRRPARGEKHTTIEKEFDIELLKD